MITIPSGKDAYQHENNFYLSCQAGRIGKLVAHAELYRMVLDVPGAIVECGIFKGASFLRFAAFRSLFEVAEARTLIGFDTFGKFPPTNHVDDRKPLEKFTEAAGNESIGREQLMGVLREKGCTTGVELVEGDICLTVPEFLGRHPELKIALLHLDVDIYEPSKVVMEQLFPRLCPGGVLVLDDYGIFPGATKAVDDFLAAQNVAARLQRFPYSRAPAYLVKVA